MLASAAVDIAMWDILGKHSQMPLYRIFGGHRDAVPCYATCAYYREGKDLEELRDEMHMLKSQGHRAFKAKIGALSLERDMQRLQVIREVIGSEAELMIDVNCGWDLTTALAAVKHLPEVNPRWLEEPVHWYDDRRLLKLLAQKPIFRCLAARMKPVHRAVERCSKSRRSRFCSSIAAAWAGLPWGVSWRS